MLKLFILFSIVSISLFLAVCHGFASTTGVRPSLTRAPLKISSTSLCMSLKPAAMPLMDAGKAIARSGELLIDVTEQELDIYGGGLSAAGIIQCMSCNNFVKA